MIKAFTLDKSSYFVLKQCITCVHVIIYSFCVSMIYEKGHQHLSFSYLELFTTNNMFMIMKKKKFASI